MKHSDFKKLFDQHFDALRNYIYYRCGDGELATDVVQEVFIKLWEKQPNKSPKQLLPLLYKMSRDNMISKLRHKKVVKAYEDAPHYHSEISAPDAVLEGKEIQEKYEKALEDMTDGQREVFLMSRNDELKYSEIADRLGISVKAVEKRMKNALAFLRKAILVLCLMIFEIKDLI